MDRKKRASSEHLEPPKRVVAQRALFIACACELRRPSCVFWPFVTQSRGLTAETQPRVPLKLIEEWGRGGKLKKSLEANHRNDDADDGRKIEERPEDSHR